MKKIVIAAAVVALVGAGTAAAQVSFARYVALGDSITAGVASGGLMQFYQERSYPGMLAQYAQANDFQQPLVSAPGLPPLLELQSFYPPAIAPSSNTPGQPVNLALARPYNNLGVPGFTIYDMLNTVGDVNNLIAGTSTEPEADLILRTPAVEVPPGSGNYVPFPAITQAIALDPTFLTMWIGNNDILGAAAYATPIDGVTMTPLAAFEAMYAAALTTLTSQTTAPMVVMTIPDVTAIPFVTTLAPYLDVPGVGRVPLIGSGFPPGSPPGPLPEDAYVTLGASSLLAQGIGIPLELGGTGIPLPEDLTVVQAQAVPGVVLRQEEVQVINARIAAMNNAIRSLANAHGIPVLDVNAFFDRIVSGHPYVVGGVDLTADFLVGGIFSYDGVHPQNIGHGIIAVELIDLVNDYYGTNIPQVNLDEVLCMGGCSNPGPPAFALSKEAVYTEEAFAQLLDLFPVRLPQVHSTRNTSTD